MAEHAGLVLGIIGTVFGIIGGVSCVNVYKTVQSYKLAPVEFSGVTAELETNKIPFQMWLRIFGLSPADSPNDIRSELRTLHAISADINNQLGHFVKVESSDTLEARITLFSSAPARLEWCALGGKRSITTRVETFSKHVNMLDRRIRFSNSIPPTFPSIEPIWVTDFRGIGHQLDLWFCRSVGGFVLCLMQSLRSLDPETKARLLKGEFMIVPEDQSSTVSVYLHNAQPVILANNWEANALPGRNFKMVMPSESDTENSSQAIALETLHRPWNDRIKPIIDDIVRISGFGGH